MAPAVSGRWTRLRALGRGASGAEVILAADDVSGELFAVKSVGAAGAAQLRREQSILSGLCSPHIIPCIGGGGRRDGGYHLFLEFAPGGSLADEVARSGGRLEEGVMRAHAADVLRGLAYLHGNSLVHGDVKGKNVVLGPDGRAKLADFGCARRVGSARPIGGTPAFMAPEVARGEEQGPAADVWALGCTVVEMATGRAPWSDMDDVAAAVHRIGYSTAVPDIPGGLSPEAKDFLGMCFRRDPRDRCTAAQLLEHPFVALAGCAAKPEPVNQERVSPKSTLDAAFWEAETDDDEAADEMPRSPADRIRALSPPGSVLPDWDSDEGWIEVFGVRCGADDTAAAPAEEAEETAGMDGGAISEGLDTEAELLGGDVVRNAGRADASIDREMHLLANSDFDEISRQYVLNGTCCNENLVSSKTGSVLPLFLPCFVCLGDIVYTSFAFSQQTPKTYYSFAHS